ncbi:MAG: hypothetical protein AAF570_13220, partial [Bacteroidota bacterium]
MHESERKKQYYDLSPEFRDFIRGRLYYRISEENDEQEKLSYENIEKFLNDKLENELRSIWGQKSQKEIKESTIKTRLIRDWKDGVYMRAIDAGISIGRIKGALDPCYRTPTGDSHFSRDGTCKRKKNKSDKCSNYALAFFLLFIGETEISMETFIRDGLDATGLPYYTYPEEKGMNAKSNSLVLKYADTTFSCKEHVIPLTISDISYPSTEIENSNPQRQPAQFILASPPLITLEMLSFDLWDTVWDLMLEINFNLEDLYEADSNEWVGANAILASKILAYSWGYKYEFESPWDTWEKSNPEIKELYGRLAFCQQFNLSLPTRATGLHLTSADLRKALAGSPEIEFNGGSLELPKPIYGEMYFLAHNFESEHFSAIRDWLYELVDQYFEDEDVRDLWFSIWEHPDFARKKAAFQ